MHPASTTWFGGDVGTLGGGLGSAPYNYGKRRVCIGYTKKTMLHVEHTCAGYSPAPPRLENLKDLGPGPSRAWWSSWEGRPH